MMVLSGHTATVNGNFLPEYTVSYPSKIESLKLTTHLHLALRLAMHEAATPVPERSSWQAQEQFHPCETFLYVKTTCLMMVLNCGVMYESFQIVEYGAANTDSTKVYDYYYNIQQSVQRHKQ
jgi:hypothetical protein